ncbi:hypothetical protein [Niastella vici]|nr:hypothetical protein [Niastella vici]
MLKTTIVAGLGLLLFFNSANAQDEGTSVGERLGNRAEEIMEMSKIGQAYQSTDQLSYDVSYDFADSAAPAIILEHKTGKYGLYDNLFWGTIDSTTEYVQGQNYYVVADHENKNILVYDRLDYSRAINVPLLDSLFNEAALLDLILTRPGGIFKKLTIKYNPGMQYRQIDMVYDSTTYLLKSIAYYYNTTIYSQAYYNCEDSVTTLVVPSTGVAMPSTITCSTLVKTYKNFIAEFPNHTKGATVRMYVSTGGAALNAIGNNPGYAAAGQTGNEIQELWILPQSVSGISKPLKDTATPPVPRKMAMMTTLAATGSWVDSTMSAMQLFEWYMNVHLGVQYSGFVYTDWLANTCGYKLYQLPWSENATVNKDTLQNIWNRFTAQYPTSQLSITETVSVPVIKNIGSNTLSTTGDFYEGDYMNILTWTSGDWFTSRQATTYDLSVLPQNASIQSALLSLYANNPSWRFAAHFRNISQFPYLVIQPVKGFFIPGITSIDLVPENYDGMSAVNLPSLSTDRVSSGNSNDFWSNQNYLNQNISSLVTAMYNNVQTTGVNYPVQYKLNDETYGTYKGFFFGGTECSDSAKRPVLNVSYTASRCDVFTAFVNKNLGTWLSTDQVKDLFKFEGKLDINSDCTAATPGAGCDGEPGPGKLITAITTISFTQTDESTFDLGLFGESRFFYKVGDSFLPQDSYSGYTITPVLNDK